MGDYLGYKFAVKSYYLEDARVWGSKFQTNQKIHPDFSIQYTVEGKCTVELAHIHCSEDLVAVIIREGEHNGRVAFADKCDLKNVFQ